MTKKKLITIVLAISVGFILILTTFKNQKKQNSGPVKETETQTTPGVATNLPQIKRLTSGYQTIYQLNVVWPSKDFLLPEKGEVFEVKSIYPDQQLISQSISLFDLNKQPLINNEYVTVYKREKDGANMVFNKKEKNFNFHLNGQDSNIQIGDVKNVSTLSSILVTTIKSLLNLSSGTDIVITKTYNQKIDGTSYVYTNQEDAKYVFMEARYTYNSLPVYNYTATTIFARLTKDGQLINLFMNLPYRETASKGIYDLKNFMDVRSFPNNQILVLSVTGEEENNAYHEDTIIKADNLQVYGGGLGYVYSAKDNSLQPYFIFDAEDTVNSTKLNFKLGIPALQERYYK